MRIRLTNLLNGTTIFILLGLMACGSCVSCGSEMKTYDMKIVVHEPLGEKAKDPIPGYIIDLLMPVTTCPEFNFRPEGKIIRVGNNPGELSLKVDLKSFSGNMKNPKLVSRLTRIELEKLSIGAKMIAPIEGGMNVDAMLAAYMGNTRIRTYCYTTDSESEREYQNHHVFFDLDSLQLQIGQDMCEDGVKTVQIILNPPSNANLGSGISPPGLIVTGNLSAELRTQLMQIGDHRTPVTRRMEMISPTLNKYFSRQKRVVKVIGQTNTIVQVSPAREYLDWLSGIVTLENLEVVDYVLDGEQKIQEISIREKHQSKIGKR